MTTQAKDPKPTKKTAAERLAERGLTPLHAVIRRLAEQMRHYPRVCPQPVKLKSKPPASPWPAPSTTHRPFKHIDEAAE